MEVVQPLVEKKQSKNPFVSVPQIPRIMRLVPPVASISTRLSNLEAVVLEMGLDGVHNEKDKCLLQFWVSQSTFFNGYYGLKTQKTVIHGKKPA